MLTPWYPLNYIIQWRIRPLLDNIDADTHRYVLTIATGNQSNAGTMSCISFIVVGSNGDSDVRSLQDGHREVFVFIILEYVVRVANSAQTLTV